MAIKSLASVVKSNREEMIDIFNGLVKSKSKLIDENGRFSLVCGFLNNPFILIDTDGDEDGIRDLPVISVGLDAANGRVLFYVDKERYYYDTDCLSLSENNVYENMWEIIVLNKIKHKIVKGGKQDRIVFFIES